MTDAGTIAEIQEHFHTQHRTDGLPVIPPQKEAVAEMLKGTVFTTKADARNAARLKKRPIC